MGIDMRECISKEENMAKGHIILLMEQFMRDNGRMEEFKEKELVLGRMAENMLDNGLQIRGMGKGSIHGRTDALMRENTEMIRDMEKEYIIGETGENMLESGKTIEDMGEANTF